MSINYSEIFERMLKAGNLKNSSEMAKILGITPQAISNYRKKSELPAGFVFKFARMYGLSVDWLLTGEGEVFRAGAGSRRKGNVCTIALVESSPAPARHGHREASNPKDLALLDPEEMLYIGKLLKVLRGADSFAAPAVKTSIDAFFGTLSASNAPSPEGKPAANPKKRG